MRTEGERRGWDWLGKVLIIPRAHHRAWTTPTRFLLLPPSPHANAPVSYAAESRYSRHPTARRSASYQRTVRFRDVMQCAPISPCVCIDPWRSPSCPSCTPGATREQVLALSHGQWAIARKDTDPNRPSGSLALRASARPAYRRLSLPACGPFAPELCLRTPAHRNSAAERRWVQPRFHCACDARAMLDLEARRVEDTYGVP